MDPLILVLDIGTSSVRASWYSPDGTGIGAGVQVRYAWDTDADGRMEIGFERLFEVCVRAIDQALHTARSIDGDVVGVACATFLHGIGARPEGESGGGRLIGWADRRGCEADSGAGSVSGSTGCAPRFWYPAARIPTLRQLDAHGTAGSAWISIGEYLYERLFGEHVISPSLAAGTGLFSPWSCAWDTAALETAGITPDHLPVLRSVADPLSGLREPWRGRWSRLADVPWAVPLGDGACANVGLGCTGPDRIGVTVGTSAAARILWHGKPAILPGTRWCYLLDKARPVAGRAFSNAGNGVAALRTMLELPEGDAFSEAVARVRPSPSLPRVRPTLVPERDAVPGDRDGMGIEGVRPDTRPEALVASWMAEVSRRVGDAVAEMASGGATEVWIGGGAVLQSPFWARLLASSAGCDIMVAADGESTSRGLALVGAEIFGHGPAIEDAPRPGGRKIGPDPAWADWFSATAPRGPESPGR